MRDELGELILHHLLDSPVKVSLNLLNEGQEPCSRYGLSVLDPVKVSLNLLNEGPKVAEVKTPDGKTVKVSLNLLNEGPPLRPWQARFQTCGGSKGFPQ